MAVGRVTPVLAAFAAAVWLVAAIAAWSLFTATDRRDVDRPRALYRLEPQGIRTISYDAETDSEIVE
jgi:hypothetical protein